MNISNAFKAGCLGATIIASTLYASLSYSGGLQSQLDGLYNTMANVTSPGTYETQRRGVISGGRITVKTKIFDEDIIGFTPPSWKAGCGGVDLYGGSFSFINSDQLVQLLRSVAANATGYMFQLALSAVCETCASKMEQLQKNIQQLNQYLGNSCQLAQGLVNGGKNAVQTMWNSEQSLYATAKGMFSDAFASKQQPDGKSAAEEVKANAPDKFKDVTGNLVWKELKKQNADRWFANGDDSLLEAMMSITGTIIIGDLIDDPNVAEGAQPEKTNKITPIAGNKVTLNDLIEGGKLRVWSCGSDSEQCAPNDGAAMTTKEVELKGLKKKIEDSLLGTESSKGIIYKFAHNDGDLTENERSFFTSLPFSIGSMIRNLAVLSPDAARIFAARASGAIALNQANTLAENLFRAVDQATTPSTNSYLDQAKDQIRASRNVVQQEYVTLETQHGNLLGITQEYTILMQNLQKQRKMLSSMFNNRR